MKKIFLKILACSFAFVIPLTAFLITTNQKNVSAGDFEQLEIEEPLSDIYFDSGYTNGFLAGTNTYIQYNYGGYQKTPLLHIPYLTSDYVTHGNSFHYNYTEDSTTIYSLTLSKYNDYMVMFSSNETNFFTIEFNNFVLFTETAYGDSFNATQFYLAVDNYFSELLQFAFTGYADINLRVDINFASDNETFFDGYHYFNSISTTTESFNHDLSSVFNGMFNAEGEVEVPNYSFGLLSGGFVNFINSGTNVLNYYNGYFIIPKLVLTLDFSNEVLFYIRSRLAQYDMLPETKYLISLYQYELLMNILAYHGFTDYSSGYDIGYDNGYDKGYADGAGDLTPFDAILHTVESFLNFKIFPKFPVYYFFLIAFGFALFGLLVKYALGG